MEEKEQGGISLGDIFRTIFSQKWLALLLVAVITIVGAIGIYFYGNSKVNYSVSFVLQLPNTGDATSTSYTYPDGESFYFTDIVSLANLKKVASREEFKSVDVDKMVRNSQISISRTVDKLDSESTDGVYDLNYTIKVKASCFDSEDAARDFIEALVSFPREYIEQMDIDYDKSLTTSKSAKIYGEKLDLLKGQTVYIQSKYNELINAYGSEFVISDGRTLSQCVNEIDSYLTQDLFASLKNKAEEQHYIMSGDTASEERLKYESELYSKKLDKTEAEATLRGLKELQSSGTVIYDEIISLTREIARLDKEIDILNQYIASYDKTDKIANAEFEAEIKKVEETVSKFTADIKPVASYLYGKVTKINYLNTRVIEAEGGTGLVTSVLVSLVAGLVVAMIVAYIVGRVKMKKAAVVEVEPVPVYHEAQLQIAATNDESDDIPDNEKKEDK